MPPPILTPEQEAYYYSTDGYKAWFEARKYRESQSYQRIPLLDCLAHITILGREGATVLDRVLEFVRDDLELNPIPGWQPLACRRVNSTVGAAFTEIFARRLVLELDGCYENYGPGRTMKFCENFGRIWAITENEARLDGEPSVIPHLDGMDVRELIITQDSLWTTRTAGNEFVEPSPRFVVEGKLERLVRTRLQEEENLRSGNLGDPKTFQAECLGKAYTEEERRRLYEDLVEEEVEKEMRRKLAYHDGKLAQFWLRLIDMLQYIPYLEVFRYESDAPMPKIFVKALAYMCRELKEVSLNLQQPLYEDERLLNIWNNLYPLSDGKDEDKPEVEEPVDVPEDEPADEPADKPADTPAVKESPKPKSPPKKWTKQKPAQDDPFGLRIHPYKRPAKCIIKLANDMEKRGELDPRSFVADDGDWDVGKLQEEFVTQEHWEEETEEEEMEEKNKERVVQEEEEEVQEEEEEQFELSASEARMIDYFGAKPLLRYDFETMPDNKLHTLGLRQKKLKNFNGNYEELRSAFIEWQGLQKRARQWEISFEKMIEDLDVPWDKDVDLMEPKEVKYLLYEHRIKRYEARDLNDDMQLEEMIEAVRAWQAQTKAKVEEIKRGQTEVAELARKTPRLQPWTNDWKNMDDYETAVFVYHWKIDTGHPLVPKEGYKDLVLPAVAAWQVNQANNNWSCTDEQRVAEEKERKRELESKIGGKGRAGSLGERGGALGRRISVDGENDIDNNNDFSRPSLKLAQTNTGVLPETSLRGGAIPNIPDYYVVNEKPVYPYRGLGKFFVLEEEHLDTKPSEFVSKFVATARMKDDVPFPCSTEIEVKIKTKQVELVRDIVESLEPFVKHFHHLSVEIAKNEWPAQATEGPNVMHPELEPQTYYTGEQKEPTHSIRQLSIINGSGALHNYLMSITPHDEIQKLHLENCTHIKDILMPLRRCRKALRKFIFRSDESTYKVAAKRAAAYYHHYISNLRMVLDFLRVGEHDLDTIELYGDFGDPHKRPFEFSGFSTELFEAIKANCRTVGRLWIDNHDLDFSITELKRILLCCPSLRDLGLSGRGMTRHDNNDDRVEEAEDGWAAKGPLAHLANHHSGLAMDRVFPLALTVLRTGWGSLVDSNYPPPGFDGAKHYVHPTWKHIHSVNRLEPGTITGAIMEMLRDEVRGRANNPKPFLPGLRHFAIYHEALLGGKRGYQIESIENPQQARKGTGIHRADIINKPHTWIKRTWNDHYRKFLEVNARIMDGRFSVRKLDPPVCSEAAEEFNEAHEKVLEKEQKELGEEQKYQDLLKEYTRLKDIPYDQLRPDLRDAVEYFDNTMPEKREIREQMIHQHFCHHVILTRQHAMLQNALEKGVLDEHDFSAVVSDYADQGEYEEHLTTMRNSTDEAYQFDALSIMLERQERFNAMFTRQHDEFVRKDCVKKREKLWRAQRLQLNQVDPSRSFDDRAKLEIKEARDRHMRREREINDQLAALDREKESDDELSTEYESSDAEMEVEIENQIQIATDMDAAKQPPPWYISAAGNTIEKMTKDELLAVAKEQEGEDAIEDKYTINGKVDLRSLKAAMVMNRDVETLKIESKKRAQEFAKEYSRDSILKRKFAELKPDEIVALMVHEGIEPPGALSYSTDKDNIHRLKGDVLGGWWSNHKKQEKKIKNRLAAHMKMADKVMKKRHNAEILAQEHATTYPPETLVDKHPDELANEEIIASFVHSKLKPPPGSSWDSDDMNNMVILSEYLGADDAGRVRIEKERTEMLRNMEDPLYPQHEVNHTQLYDFILRHGKIFYGVIPDLYFDVDDHLLSTERADLKGIRQALREWQEGQANKTATDQTTTVAAPTKLDWDTDLTQLNDGELLAYCQTHGVDDTAADILSAASDWQASKQEAELLKGPSTPKNRSPQTPKNTAPRAKQTPQRKKSKSANPNKRKKPKQQTQWQRNKARLEQLKHAENERFKRELNHINQQKEARWQKLFQERQALDAALEAQYGGDYPVHSAPYLPQNRTNTHWAEVWSGTMERIWYAGGVPSAGGPRVLNERQRRQAMAMEAQQIMADRMARDEEMEDEGEMDLEELMARVQGSDHMGSGMGYSPFPFAGAGGGAMGWPPMMGNGPGMMGPPPPFMGYGAGMMGQPPPFGNQQGMMGPPPPFMGYGRGMMGQPPPFGNQPGMMGPPPPVAGPGGGAMGWPPAMNNGPGMMGPPPPFMGYGRGMMGPAPPFMGNMPGMMGPPPPFGNNPGTMRPPPPFMGYNPGMMGPPPQFGGPTRQHQRADLGFYTEGAQGYISSDDSGDEGGE